MGPYNYFMAPRLVFVPGRNRIYAFGGKTRSEDNEVWSHDEIFYFDLNLP